MKQQYTLTEVHINYNGIVTAPVGGQYVFKDGRLFLKTPINSPVEIDREDAAAYSYSHLINQDEK